MTIEFKRPVLGVLSASNIRHGSVQVYDRPGDKAWVLQAKIDAIHRERARRAQHNAISDLEQQLKRMELEEQAFEDGDSDDYDDAEEVDANRAARAVVPFVEKKQEEKHE